MSLSSKEYFIKETYKSIRRNGFMSFASLSTVALSLLVLGMVLLMFLNTNNWAQHLENQVQITVYMKEDASNDLLKSTKESLQKLPGVVSVEAVTKQQALQKFKERLGQQAKLLDSLGKDNPFPYSFQVHVDVPERVQELIPEINKLKGIETAKFAQQTIKQLFELSRIIRICGIVVILMLCVATTFIIANTIRLTVFARSREITIMKYVGATDWFIRWPFLLEGLTFGLGGAAIAIFIINSLYTALLERIYTTLAFLPMLKPYPTLFWVDFFVIFVGCAIGMAGSYVSLRKFLRV